MTAAVLLAALRRRGIEVIANNGTICARPRARLTDVDPVALRQHKAEVLTLLDNECDERGAGLPASPCEACGLPLTWVEDWPTAGERRWLCLACAGRPVSSLEAVYASLTPAERRRPLDEASAGDPLARILLTLVPVSGAA